MTSILYVHYYALRVYRGRVITLESRKGRHMDDIHYDRICRTESSEAYLISQGDEPVARVELHYTHSVVYGLLIVEKDFSEDEVADLIAQIDDDLVDSADVPRDDFVVTVYRGQELGVYSDPDLAEEFDADEDEETS